MKSLSSVRLAGGTPKAKRKKIESAFFSFTLWWYLHHLAAISPPNNSTDFYTRFLFLRAVPRAAKNKLTHSPVKDVASCIEQICFEDHKISCQLSVVNNPGLSDPLSQRLKLLFRVLTIPLSACIVRINVPSQHAAFSTRGGMHGGCVPCTSVANGFSRCLPEQRRLGSSL